MAPDLMSGAIFMNWASLNISTCIFLLVVIRFIGSIKETHRGVAQVVECLLREQEAVGSSPATPTNGKIPLTTRTGV